jgi:hypothetical protein
LLVVAAAGDHRRLGTKVIDTADQPIEAAATASPQSWPRLCWSPAHGPGGQCWTGRQGPYRSACYHRRHCGPAPRCHEIGE